MEHHHRVIPLAPPPLLTDQCKNFPMPHPRGPWHSDICYYCKKLGHWKKNCPQRKFISQIPPSCYYNVSPAMNHLFMPWSYYYYYPYIDTMYNTMYPSETFVNTFTAYNVLRLLHTHPLHDYLKIHYKVCSNQALEYGHNNSV